MSRRAEGRDQLLPDRRFLRVEFALLPTLSRNHNDAHEDVNKHEDDRGRGDAPTEPASPLRDCRIIARHDDFARAPHVAVNIARNRELTEQLRIVRQLLLQLLTVGGRKFAVEVVKELVGIHRAK